MNSTDNENTDSKKSIGKFETNEQSRSRIRAIKILGNRSLSSSEMEKRLKNKGESPETASGTVQWLESIGAVNDVEYAAAIASHYSNKGYGLSRIKDELYKRGIPRDLWDDAIEGIDSSDAEDAAAEFIEKRLRGSTDKNDIRRTTDALCRRGFNYEDARTAVNRYLESIANTEDSEDTEH